MSVRHLLAAAAAALLAGIGLAAPAAAHVSAQSAEVGAYTLTAARFWATAAALLALAGVVIGRQALTRSVRRIGNAGKGAIMALVAGTTAVVGGAVNLAVADGGPGTGNGVVGGAAAVVLGLIATVLGWLALARSRRTG